MSLPGREHRLVLSQVTLCAVSSVNVSATMQALERCMEQINFAAAYLFTDAPHHPTHEGITVVQISRLTSSGAYSDFLLSQLVDHVDTTHCLIVQWDGHVIDARHWLPAFLEYDYIGASWPQFADGHDVGNGGFSLRSRRLLKLCRDPAFQRHHPEDVAIGRDNRVWLEAQGMRFAPRELADLFSAERAGDVKRSFGYHGIWLMPQAIGVHAFWAIYRELDDRGTIRHDFANILMQIWRGRGGLARALQLISDQIFYGSGR